MLRQSASYGTKYRVRQIVHETGTRQLGTCQIRHRVKEQTRHLLNSAPVKFSTYILHIRHLGFANSAPDVEIPIIVETTMDFGDVNQL